eukprot:6121463-Alexandrium_andersonii.AAC.1
MDIPVKKHGFMIRKVLTGDAKLLIDHLTDAELMEDAAAKNIRNILAEAYRHVTDFEDQQDF